ncbi:hypothetical protein SAMN05443432_104385 [Roseovarius litoreus]|uniref:DUF6455 domain-containing protein n=1 Tax=Roseovarius litoreus TaxID=1155722 RepID=A0A1M7G0I6_9RHOB|nr:DUF6455 family protein [Roseovarius litoreus]SHM09447.1 hypothetical protein SAMN05443432_104385 [Roseovarius litoreus]
MNAHVAYLGDPTRHFWLTRSVARAMNLNLSEAMAHGYLSARAYSDMITRCRTCQHVESCELWLASSAGGARCAPAHCVHADILNDLADRMGTG